MNITQQQLDNLIMESIDEVLNEKYNKNHEQLDENVVAGLAMLYTAARVAVMKGGPMVLKGLRAGAPHLVNVVRKTAVPVFTGYSILNLTKDLSSGAGEVYSDAKEAAADLAQKVGEGVSGKTIFEIAEIAVKFALPIGIVLAILYGGKKLLDRLLSSTDEKSKIRSTDTLPLEYYQELEKLNRKYKVRDDRLSMDESINEETLEEKAPPGMEDFVKKIKPKMEKQYGKRGLSIAIALAWKKYRQMSGKNHGRK